jgi:Gpi18-like mannosyltransferase
LFFIAYSVRSWAVIPGADSLALLFTLVGVYLVSCKKILWSVPLFVLAIYTKQDYIVAPLAVGLYLLWKDRKLVLPFVLSLIVLVLVPFFVINYYTHGQFYQHILVFPTQSTEGVGMQWGTIPNSILHMVGWNLVPILLGFTGWIYVIWKRMYPILIVWFLVAFVVMTVLIGKPGSGYNYGLELVSVSCVLGCLFVKEMLSREWFGKKGKEK